MKRLRRLMLMAGFSVLDQGLLSASNFGLSVALARFISVPDYGAFALDLNIFLIIAGLHNCLVIEPMSVLGPARHSAHLCQYLRSTLWIHLALTIFLALVGLVSAAALHDSMTPGLVAMAASLPVLLLFWVLRRAHYIETRPADAATASGIYLAVLATFAFVSWKFGVLSTVSGFVGMAIASLAASIFSLSRLKISILPNPKMFEDCKALVRENWNFGRWLLPSVLLYPLVAQVQIFVTGTYLGLGAAGILRALQNPILPVLQVVTALSTLAIPILARDFSQYGPTRVLRRAVLFTAGMTLVSACYELTVLIAGNLWDRLLYGGRYVDYDWLMPVLGLMPIAVAVTTGSALFLRAIQRPELTTLTYAIGAIFGAASAFFLIHRYKVAGAVYGLVLSQAVAALASVVVVRRAALRARSAGLSIVVTT